ncbi:MAG: leucine-rich repeat protein [Prevotellaceae bacterium]|nr:leucine-rich repeat protein [Candidatus Minthosoma caballi]
MDGITYETQLGYKAKVLGIPNSKDISIPSTVTYGDKTLRVTSITPGILANCTTVSLPAEYDFGSNSTLKKLYIDEGVTSFRGFASCTALEDVSLPGSLTSIEYTFTNCKSIKTIAFRHGPTKLKGLNDNTFKNIMLDSIFVDREFEYSFNTSYTTPFDYNPSLRAIRIGDNLKTVAAGMFYNCNELRTIILGNSLTSIEKSAFADCEKVTGTIEIPGSVKSIGDDAFKWTSHGYGMPIKYVLNEGLESIGANAFSYVDIHEINIPSTVKTIGADAFSSTLLENITIEDAPKYSGTLSLQTTSFGSYLRYVESIYLGRNISFPSSSYKEGPFHLSSEHKLKSLIIGDNVTTLPKNIFYETHVNSVTIGSGLTSISEDAFYGSGLREVIINATSAPYLFSQVFSSIPVYVPAGSKDSYQAADYWKNCNIIDPNDALIIVNLTMPGTLEGRLRIQKVEPANVYKLKITGEMNDDDWEYIKKINMPKLYSLDLSEVTNSSIPTQQFQAHTYLVNVVLPNGITTIGDYAFEKNYYLTGDFVMPTSLIKIGDYAFWGTNIGNVSISSNVSVGNHAFDNSKLKSISLNKDASIGEYTFYDCSNLESVTLNKCTSIGQYAFAGCTNLSGSYQLYSQLTAIPDYAFKNCSSLEGIELPKTLKTIGNGAFQYCSKITSLEFHNAITSFGSTTSSFAGCSGITTIKTHWTKPISTLAATFSSVNKNKCTLYVPKRSTDWYLLTTGWDEFVNVVEYDDTEKDVAELNLIDGDSFENDYNKRIGTLTFSKTFSASSVGKWNAFYVPMSIDVEEYAGELDFAEIYSFCATVDTNGDGTVDANDENFLFVRPVKTGCIEPNVPYLIRPKAAKTYVINSADNILYKSTEGKVEFSTTLDKFTVTGLNNAFTVTAGDNNYYVSASGALNIRTTGSTTVKANRWIMHRESKKYGGANDGTSYAREYRIVTIGEDMDETTAIETIRMSNASNTESNDVYTIDGRRVNAEHGLSKGIYIKNGKKYFVK